MLGTSLGHVPTSPKLATSLLVGGLAAVLVSIPIAAAVLVRPSAGAACAPALELGSLSERDRGFVARRVMACGDRERGELTAAEYRARTAKIDAAWDARAIAAPSIEWASSVREVSSQYLPTSWAATRVLGPPDVYPTAGDNASAWASLGADDRREWIEVGYDQPMPISAVEVYETFNPGAIERIELITASGSKITAFAGQAQARGQAAHLARFDVGCTSEPIVAVRVLLDSQAVPGWNELDAIGIVPCLTP